MKWAFIPNRNYQQLEEVSNELLIESSGIEIAVVHAPYGRGKSIASQHLITMNGNAVYVYFEPRFSIAALVREVAFKIGGTRPRSTQSCVDLIQEGTARQRRILLIDEADQMSLKHLNQLRAFHDLHGMPIILIGEDSLLSKISNEGRLMSRVRRILKFEPVSQADITIFYRKALSLTLIPEHTTKLLRHSNGDFRKVIVDAAKAERIMKANGLKGINDAVVSEVCK